MTVQFVVVGIDPDNDLSRCDKYLDGALVSSVNFASATSGTTFTLSHTFSTAGTHRISFQAVNKQNHYRTGAHCTVEVIKPIVDIKLRVMTYDIQRTPFDDCPKESIACLVP